MLLDIFVPQNRERDVLALEFALDHCPVRFGLAAMALLRPGVLVQLGFEDRVGEVVRQRPGQPGLRKSLYGLTDRRRREPCSPSDLVFGNSDRTKTQNLAHLAHRNSPRWHSSAPRPKPKSRPYAKSAEAPPFPGGFIPESWARIDRNAGRQLIGIDGRHHLGINGRLASDSAFPPLVRPRSLSATSAGRRGSSIRPKRRSASCWKDCAARRTSRSCAAGKALPPRCITAGRRSSWRPASAGWRATAPAPRRPAR